MDIPVARRPYLRPRQPLLAAVGLLTLLAACGGGSSGSSSTGTAGAGPIATDPTVEVSDNRFTPDALTVAAGTEVTWTWAEGSALHNVVGDGFESETQPAGIFVHRFDTTGTFSYVCTLHSGMEGTVIVVN